MSPHLAILHSPAIPEETFEEFLRTVGADGLDLRIESRESSGAFAAIEWIVPTVVIAYIGKSYFDGFLKEMGKDHYSLLKSAFKQLYEKMVGPSAPQVSVASSAHKVSSDSTFSLFFSLVAEGVDGVQFKLLIARNASEADYEASVCAFLTFVEQFHAGALDSATLDTLRAARIAGRTLLLAYDSKVSNVVPVDPYAGRGA